MKDLVLIWEQEEAAGSSLILRGPLGSCCVPVGMAVEGEGRARTKGKGVGEGRRGWQYGEAHSPSMTPFCLYPGDDMDNFELLFPLK